MIILWELSYNTLEIYLLKYIEQHNKIKVSGLYHKSPLTWQWFQHCWNYSEDISFNLTLQFEEEKEVVRGEIRSVREARSIGMPFVVKNNQGWMRIDFVLMQQNSE